MGAQTFMTKFAGKTPEQAFREAVQHALWEYGHRGYTGSLAEKHDFVLIQHEPLESKEAEDLAYQLIDREDKRIRDKWGPAGCIPLKTGEYLFFGWASS